ncbi:MAG: hypothetical protein P8Y45_21775 [Exilibacterium sp.]
MKIYQEIVGFGKTALEVTIQMLSKNMKLTILLLTTIYLSGCVSVTKKSSIDDRLLGIWVINHSPLKFDYSIIEYQPSGDKCEIEYDFDSIAGLQVFAYWNKWRTEGDLIRTVMHKTNSSIPIDYEINDKILLLTDGSLDVVISDPGEWDVEYHQRVPMAESGQVCNIVKVALGE